MDWAKIDELQNRRAELIGEMQRAKAFNDRGKMNLIRGELAKVDEEAENVADEGGYTIR